MPAVVRYLSNSAEADAVAFDLPSVNNRVRFLAAAAVDCTTTFVCGALSNVASTLKPPQEHRSVVRFWPYAENRAVGDVRYHSSRVFCSYLCKTVRHVRKMIAERESLFYTGPDRKCDRRHSLSGASGVVPGVSRNDVPTQVPRDIVEALITHADQTGKIDRNPSFKVGDTNKSGDGLFGKIVWTLRDLEVPGGFACSTS